MKFKSYSYTLVSLLVLAMLSGCKREINEPLTPIDPSVPGVVTDITSVGLPAQVRLTYRLPDSKVLSYVKAVYTLKSGEQREVKSSGYTNTMILDGFGDTLQHVVKVYSVSKSEIASAPVEVTVKALENPIWQVYRSLKVYSDFAGMSIESINKYKGFNIAIIPFIMPQSGKTATTEWKALDGIYTATDTIKSTVRGLDTVPTKVMIYVRDRFLNYTDTFYTTVTPLYEAPLVKSLYKVFQPEILPGDIRANYSSSGAATGIKTMWDGNTFDWPSCAYTPPTENNGPHSITFDAGQLAKLSRIVIWDYPEYYTNNGFTRAYYYRGSIKNFEIWGSQSPNIDGSWASWTLLGDFTCVKPSGSPYGVMTTEDYTKANAGLSYSFRIDVPKMRYIRIKNKTNWQGSNFFCIAEVQLYGDNR